MLNEDELKIAQRALDYLMANADLESSEVRAAKRAYHKLDALIDGDEICSGWCIEDVFSLMFPDEDGICGHTDEEIAIAREVLKAAEADEDATIGINWDVLQYHLGNVMEQRVA